MEQLAVENVSQGLVFTDDIKTKAGKVFDLLDVNESTRAEYKLRIALFLDFARDKEFNFNIFLEFKRYLADRTDFGVSTKNKYLITARVFLKELNRCGLLPSDVTQNVKTFKQDRKHKREGLNEAEIKLLTEKIRQLPATPQNTRLKAILSLLALQGLRQIEVVRLNVQDVDFVGKTALVKGKGMDDKEIIHLHLETVRALKEYLQVNRVSDGVLFASKSNNSRNKRLTTRTLRKIVKETLKQLGIEKTTHGFRHYFTSALIKAYKGDLLEVARYTRHKSLEMLQVYNDNIKLQADLPRFYEVFKEVVFDQKMP
ncbi:MAG: integrase [Planctomycetes bacterium RIFCSPLOWO2_12_FULL_39_13]|nr:MAG: integrase [Planctomycetes bacterium RIFCSPLOWO2_12_FULL_39_13]